MSNRKPRVDDEIVYYSEPRTRGGEPGGPFPARVTAVGVNKEDELKVNLSVQFDTAVRDKTLVAFSATPAKHCWSWPPPAPSK
jgi:hypothetical protein